MVKKLKVANGIYKGEVNSEGQPHGKGVLTHPKEFCKKGGFQLGYWDRQDSSLYVEEERKAEKEATIECNEGVYKGKVNKNNEFHGKGIFT
jgi:hypothetical protein